MIASDGLLRARELEAYEGIASLDEYADAIRLILVEASMLSERYRYVQRHDVPHVRELTGLIDLLRQEIEMTSLTPRETSPLEEVGTY